jgi:hypothetical protein
LAVVQRSRSGQGPQRQSNTARRLGVIATVQPAGQVTVLACRSTAKFGRLGSAAAAECRPAGCWVWWSWVAAARLAVGVEADP